MKKMVLIVDDEIDVLSVLEKRLSVAGFQVIKADSGIAALQLAKKLKPDLILLDVMMPGMEGGDVASELRKDSATAKIPIIFLTCLFTKKEETAEGHTLGNEVFVAKPYNFDELVEQINKQLKI